MRNLTRNFGARVLVVTVMSLLALLAVPVGRNSATAQNWERVPYYETLVAFDRRDDQGLIYYGVLRDVHEMPGKRYAADCSRGLIYSYDEVGRKWHKPYHVTEVPTKSIIAGVIDTCARIRSLEYVR